MTLRRFAPLPSAPDARGPGSPATLLQRDVPRFLHDLHAAAPWYRPSPELADAVNVALAVGAPLLLTGEPGSGKTQLAWHLAWYFNVPTEPDSPIKVTDAERRQPFVFHTRSTSLASDLLYRFDTVQYFHDAQDKNRTLHKPDYLSRGPLWRAFAMLETGAPAIVLIDEVDKAPRDFPNDLLHELSQYEIDIPETGQTIRRPADVDPPLVIVTSNEERRLPDAFLRRCVYHHIVVTRDTLVQAATAHLQRLLGDGPPPDGLLDAAVDAVEHLRQDRNLSKRPSTGELLAWLTALVRAGHSAADLRGVRRDRLPFRGVLLKDHADLAAPRGA